jgi:cytochrome c biogenesis protein CcmG/thiol:disulfide interchange protein DsbE
LVSASGIGTEVTVVLLRDAKKLTKTLKLVVRPDELKIVKDRLEGKPMPAFNLPVIGRKESVDSKSLRGRVTVIEFWATWCPACRASHGRLSQFASKHKDIAVLGISDEDTETLESFVKDTKPQFTVLQDVSQKSQVEYMATAIPMIVVVKKNGDVAMVQVGAGQELEQALESAIQWSAHSSAPKSPALP